MTDKQIAELLGQLDFNINTTIQGAIEWYEQREVEMSDGDLRDDIVRLLRFIQSQRKDDMTYHRGGPAPQQHYSIPSIDFGDWMFICHVKTIGRPADVHYDCSAYGMMAYDLMLVFSDDSGDYTIMNHDKFANFVVKSGYDLLNDMMDVYGAAIKERRRQQ